MSGRTEGGILSTDRFDFLARATGQKSRAGQSAFGRRLINSLQRSRFEGDIGSDNPAVVLDQRNADKKSAGRQFVADIGPAQDRLDRRGGGQRLVFRPKAQRLDCVRDQIFFLIRRGKQTLDVGKVTPNALSASLCTRAM